MIWCDIVYIHHYPLVNKHNYWKDTTFNRYSHSYVSFPEGTLCFMFHSNDWSSVLRPLTHWKSLLDLFEIGCGQPIIMPGTCGEPVIDLLGTPRVHGVHSWENPAGSMTYIHSASCKAQPFCAFHNNADVLFQYISIISIISHYILIISPWLIHPESEIPIPIPWQGTLRSCSPRVWTCSPMAPCSCGMPKKMVMERRSSCSGTNSGNGRKWGMWMELKKNTESHWKNIRNKSFEENQKLKKKSNHSTWSDVICSTRVWAKGMTHKNCQCHKGSLLGLEPLCRRLRQRPCDNVCLGYHNWAWTPHKGVDLFLVKTFWHSVHC